MTTLQEEHADLSDAHTSLSQSTSSSTTSLKLQVASLIAEQTALQTALTESCALAAQHEATISSLQSQLLSQSREERKPPLNEDEARDMAVVRDELHRQASYLRLLEKENAKLMREVTILRENHISLEVVREEKRGLERKLQTMDEMRTKVVKLEAEVEAARKEREAWFVDIIRFHAYFLYPFDVQGNVASARTGFIISVGFRCSAGCAYAATSNPATRTCRAPRISRINGSASPFSRGRTCRC